MTCSSKRLETGDVELGKRNEDRYHELHEWDESHE